jgi:hypothetical protein
LLSTQPTLISSASKTFFPHPPEIKRYFLYRLA